jgi:hypothetical protein
MGKFQHTSFKFLPRFPGHAKNVSLAFRISDYQTCDHPCVNYINFLYSLILILSNMTDETPLSLSPLHLSFSQCLKTEKKMCIAV